MTEETGTTETLSPLRLKMDEYSERLSGSLRESKVKAEENIKKHPLTCVMGALAGGITVSYLIARRRKT